MNGPIILCNSREQLAEEIFAYREPISAPNITVEERWFWCNICGLPAATVHNTKRLSSARSGRKTRCWLGSRCKAQKLPAVPSQTIALWLQRLQEPSAS